MSAPIIWIITPAIAAVLFFIFSRQRYWVIGGGVGVSLLLALLAWQLKLDEVIMVGNWAFIIHDDLVIAGRRFLISNADRPKLALFYGAAAFWYLGAAVIRTHRWFISLSLGTIAVFIAALSVEPILFAALLIELGVLLIVLMLTPPGEPVNRGVLRFLIYQTLGMPFILMAGWFLGSVEVAAGNLADIVRVAILLGFGFAFHMGVFPLHSWIPMMTEKVHPYSAGFVLTTFLSVSTLFAEGFLQRFPWLQLTFNVLEVIGALGIIMLVIGGVFAGLQKHLGRMLGFAVIVEVGRTLLMIGVEGGMQLFFALSFTRILSLGIWALSLAILKEHLGDLSFRTIQGWGRRYPMLGFSLILAHFSLVGLPLLVGFPTSLLLWETLASSGTWVLLWALVGSAGLLVGGLRSLAVMAMGPDDMPLETEQQINFFQQATLLLGIAALLIFGLFPQWYLPLLTSISVSFGAPIP